MSLYKLEKAACEDTALRGHSLGSGEQAGLWPLTSHRGLCHMCLTRGDLEVDWFPPLHELCVASCVTGSGVTLALRRERSLPVKITLQRRRQVTNNTTTIRQGQMLSKKQHAQP